MHGKCNVKGAVWGPGDKTRKGGSTQECFPLFKGPGIEGGIFFMGTFGLISGVLCQRNTTLVHWLCPFTHKPFKLGICIGPELVGGCKSEVEKFLKGNQIRGWNSSGRKIKGISLRNSLCHMAMSFEISRPRGWFHPSFQYGPIPSTLCRHQTCWFQVAFNFF